MWRERWRSSATLRLVIPPSHTGEDAQFGVCERRPHEVPLTVDTYPDCSFDVELCRAPGVLRAGLAQGQILDQRRLEIVDQAEALVAVPQPLPEEGGQQPVSLGRA